MCRLSELFKGTPVSLPNMPETPQLDFPVYEIEYRALVEKIIADYGIEFMLSKKYWRPDPLFYYTSLAGLKKIAPYLVIPADRYVKGLSDCDDYTREARSRYALHFGLSSFDCWGKCDFAPSINDQANHSFFITVVGTPDKIEVVRIVEPNAGFQWAGKPFMPDENQYHLRAFKH